MRLLLLAILAALPAFPQFDAAGLRLKFGAPLPREIFTVRPGIEITVDYAPNSHVCRIQLPPIGPTSRDPAVISPQAIDAVLADLLPLNLRGKELRRSMSMMGIHSTSIVE